MRVTTVVGARPQFIKATVVSNGFRNSSIEETIIHTGQHYNQNMSEIFFEELGISPPKKNLSIGGGTHGQNTGRMIEALEGCFFDDRPDWVLVYGDTDSTLAAALAAAKLLIPIAHIEAGLRSFNRLMPEEINRVATDHMAQLLFSPTKIATQNLIRESIEDKRIVQCGDVMFDATVYFGSIAQKKSKILNKLSLREKSYILTTVHRAENTNNINDLLKIFEGLSESAIPIVFPIHPRTKSFIIENQIAIPSNINPIDPVGYLDMLTLEKNASLIITDSGGVQKEAYFHKVPCITLREETEWVELVENGFNRLVGSDPLKIKNALTSTDEIDFESCQNLYGNGNSVKIIIDRFLKG